MSDERRVEVNDDDTYIDTTEPGVEEIATPALPEGAEEPDDGELDPDDDYTEGTTREWIESLPDDKRPPAFRSDR